MIPPSRHAAFLWAIAAVVLIPLLLCSTAASAATAEAKADPADKLRSSCFRFVERKLSKRSIDSVQWSSGMTMTFAGFDKSNETLKATSGESSLDVPLRSIKTRDLATLMKAASGSEDSPDADGYILAAVLLLSDGDQDGALRLVERAKMQAAGVDESFARWVGLLGLEIKAPEPKPIAEAKKTDGGENSEIGNAGESAPQVSGGGKLPTGIGAKRRAVSKEHPRLFGSRARLQALAQERAVAYSGMVSYAKTKDGNDPTALPAMALVSCLEGDADLAREAIARVMVYANGPIKVGHVTFGHDLALSAMVYDHCWSYWKAEEKATFIEYMNKTVDANVGSETSPFHNGYYGYKNWGIGLACYATMYENPRAAEILATLDNDFRTRAVPCLELAGDGGAWSEGHYIHYWNYEWLVFCEAARLCEGVDYYPLAPKFFANRAVASMFQMLPGHQPMEMNRAVPDGDGGYGTYGGFSEKILAARRILVNYYRNDLAHQMVHTYNQIVPHLCIPEYAYMDFLWNDLSVAKADLKSYKLSHYAPGAGHVYARSSWDGDSTYLFFKCSDRMTAHQQLDVGHFFIYRQEHLAGDSGVYDAFDSNHCANYYLRSIAHNTMLVYDPSEKFPDGIRAGPASANDGGQWYPWYGTPMGHNGGCADYPMYAASKQLTDIADVLAYEDHGSWMYTAGDCSRAYNPAKLSVFTRQIVFIRPSTFVIFDRVKSTKPEFKKTWVLNLHKAPTGTAPNIVSTNGNGKLFIQTVLPANAEQTLHQGAQLYAYEGKTFPPRAAAGAGVPLPECRLEVSPKTPLASDVFLHVLTATDGKTDTVPKAEAKSTASDVTVTVGSAVIRFEVNSVGGSITVNGQKGTLANKIQQ
ncbi:MAG: heparinase II/III family protein [Planctomycetes bacterium]|nr:heparinase II/III family protein [Planctomycetota bacterium]